MTKSEFWERWNSDEAGGGITNDDCADCYIEWGLGKCPRSQPIIRIVKAVVAAAEQACCKEK